MRDLLKQYDGVELSLDDYRAEFAKYFWTCGEVGFWKLERRATFREHSNKSWDAFMAGNWSEALRLLDERIPRFIEDARKMADQGLVSHRVRIVEQPLTPYLQWELQSFFRRANARGDEFRIVTTDQVAKWESASALPELVVLGDQVMYEVNYDNTGLSYGATRYDNPELIGQCREFIQQLYADGEPLESYFAREVAELPPPKVDDIQRI